MFSGGMKNDANFGFLTPLVLGALLRNRYCKGGVEKFRDVGFPTSEEVWRQREKNRKEKKLSVK